MGAELAHGLKYTSESGWISNWEVVFFLAGLVFTFKLVKLCQANTPFKCLGFPSRGQTTRKPPPCHSPVLGRSAFENTAGQIEIFFCGLFFEKNAGFQPFLIFIHVHPSWSDGTACMILVHVPCVLPWPCRKFSPKLRWWRQMARPFRRASQ